MPLRTILVSLALAPAVAAAEVPAVAVDIAPVHSLVSRVMEGVGKPTLLVRPGASPHGYAMRPSEAKALQDADLFVWVGESLTPWLEGPVETLAAGETLELLDADGTHLLPLVEEGRDDGHGHDVAFDPHAWLDPENGKLWLDEIADRLAALDPANANTYRANATAGRAEIDAAAAEAVALLTEHRTTPFVVYHNAYGYFADSFGLPAAIAVTSSDAAAPSAARVSEVAGHLKNADVTCVFAEPQFGAALVRSVTEDMGSEAAILDPLGGALIPGPSLYPSLLRDLARTIADCNA